MFESKLYSPACAGGIMVGIVAKGKKNSGKARENTKHETAIFSILFKLRIENGELRNF